ncbi:hypothetical protein BJV77DRAFT_1178972 [Russula vinacea]|nr:hypothetical protein BJV77DRAFT_1178972 [Russula vinacea]
MYYSISTTPPGTSALAFPSTPLLAAPFDSSNGLQSNAYYSGTLSSHRESQIGLGILFGSSDSLSRVDNFAIPVDDDPVQDHPPFLDSLRPPTLNALSPPNALRSRCSPAPEDDFCLVGADLSASTSAFSIRDWIIHPSSSPATSDALRGSPTAPQQCGLKPDASPRLATRSPTSLTQRVLSSSWNVSRYQSSPTNTVAIDKHLRFAWVDGNGLSPGCRAYMFQSRNSRFSNSLSVPRANFDLQKGLCVTPCIRTSELTTSGYGVQYWPKPRKIVRYSRRGTRRVASNSSFNVGTTLMSPRNIFSSNGFSLSMGLLVSPDTPVFNMHEGVSEYDLQRRANRYRRRYPGRSLDRHWLLKYAGKLNKDGKAMADYRCYISGCPQINKRRDHIIVHICSHVNERPFACRHCHMTFLRRNECKRHEAGHSGLKPFVCRFCSPPAARFARQDLLTRHARRAHGMTPREHREMFQQTPEMLLGQVKMGLSQRDCVWLLSVHGPHGKLVQNRNSLCN